MSNMHSLQELTINNFNQTFLQSYMSAKLAAGLTALTRLELYGCRVSCLSHVSKCESLKVLHMGCPDGLEEEMGPGDWAALGELTWLVELELLNAKFPNTHSGLLCCHEQADAVAQRWCMVVVSRDVAFVGCMHPLD